jgi:hypothetical protein
MNNRYIPYGDMEGVSILEYIELYENKQRKNNMKKGYTDITFILDRSGSMGDMVDEVINGFNSFISEQNDGVDECRVSLIQFDDRYEVNYVGINVDSVTKLDNKTYIPRGFTALYDAIGKTMISMGERFVKLDESERPDKVILIIMTDGAENSSKEYNAESIKTLIEKQKTDYSWEIVFMGTNQDAVLTATSIGISGLNALSYANTKDGTATALYTVTLNTKLYRGGQKVNMSF